MERDAGSPRPYVGAGMAGLQGVLAGRDKGSACAPKHGQRSRMWIEHHAPKSFIDFPRVQAKQSKSRLNVCSDLQLRLRAELKRRTLPLRSRDFFFNWNTAWDGVESVPRVVVPGPLCSSLYG